MLAGMNAPTLVLDFRTRCCTRFVQQILGFLDFHPTPILLNQRREIDPRSHLDRTILVRGFPGCVSQAVPAHSPANQTLLLKRCLYRVDLARRTIQRFGNFRHAHPKCANRSGEIINLAAGLDRQLDVSRFAKRQLVSRRGNRFEEIPEMDFCHVRWQTVVLQCDTHRPPPAHLALALDSALS